MTTLTDAQARALRLKIADRQGDIANAQADIDAMLRELGEASAPDPVEPPASPVVKPSVLPPYPVFHMALGAPMARMAQHPFSGGGGPTRKPRSYAFIIN